ncbi:MAG: hypothetical protein K5779_00325 [Saccharofermentans sp.]|nr:hypothetical protein [Saccharofermentans sp.]
MNQDPDTKRKKIRCYKEVELRESEFKKASELDSDEFKNIHDEFFRRTVVNPLIGIFIAASVFVLWPAGVVRLLLEFSEEVGLVAVSLMGFCGAMIPYFTVRCIFSLTIVSRIKKKAFWWRAGHITRKKNLWISFGMEHYYIVDDEYCSRSCFDPFYRKGTEVYFLYFPGFMRGSYMGGVVVKKKE